MKKNLFYFIVIILIIITISIIYYITRQNKLKTGQEQINSEKLSSEIQLNEETSKNLQISTNEEIHNQEEYRKANPTETELSSYSSPLKDKSSGRLNNIRITCSSLNGTKVPSGNTFSFCDTLGPSTSEKGYKKASVIIDKKTVQALGGGNCQVSSTLYNAILAIPQLDVIERHEHGKNVTYVPEGKDAAVSYGSLDLKFKNTLSDDIKLYFSSDDINVTVKIMKLTY